MFWFLLLIQARLTRLYLKYRFWLTAIKELANHNQFYLAWAVFQKRKGNVLLVVRYWKHFVQKVTVPKHLLTTIYGVSTVFQDSEVMPSLVSQLPLFTAAKNSLIFSSWNFARELIAENLGPKYLEKDEYMKGHQADKSSEVFQDVTTTFFVLLAIYFPAVTGILTGTNMSGKSTTDWIAKKISTNKNSFLNRYRIYFNVVGNNYFNFFNCFLLFVYIRGF